MASTTARPAVSLGVVHYPATAPTADRSRRGRERTWHSTRGPSAPLAKAYKNDRETDRLYVNVTNEGAGCGWCVYSKALSICILHSMSMLCVYSVWFTNSPLHDTALRYACGVFRASSLSLSASLKNAYYTPRRPLRMFEPRTNPTGASKCVVYLLCLK